MTARRLNAKPYDPGAPFGELNAQGLNLQAVFDVAVLPADVRQQLPGEGAGFRRLLLVGHRGPRLWQQLQARRVDMTAADPIDAFTRQQVDAWLQQRCPGVRHAWLYPGNVRIGLQRLGQLAGWHHPSPFRVGIQAGCGSWFAYRAALLLDADLPPSAVLRDPSPCAACATRDCVAACPAQALQGDFKLEACIDQRLQDGSACAERCLARNACPVGAVHRYSDAQIAYHYRQSLTMLRAWRGAAAR